jgi:hypothetical protein
MFTCERCGCSFSPIRAAVLEYCPRCRARDGVAVPLIFSLFKDPPAKDKDSTSDRPTGLRKSRR